MLNTSRPPFETPGATLSPRLWLPRAVLLLAALLMILALFGIYLNYRPLPFDPVGWQNSNGIARGRMLKSLLAQTRFVGFPRAEVEHYLGPADFDDRQIWYDLGPADDISSTDPRAAVGEPGRLYGVFAYDKAGAIKEVLYNHRRPILGSRPFDSTGWFGPDRKARRAMFTHALGRLRELGLTRPETLGMLGRPDGERVRGQYDIGRGGAIFGRHRALILEYDVGDSVQASFVAE